MKEHVIDDDYTPIGQEFLRFESVFEVILFAAVDENQVETPSRQAVE